VYNRTVSESRDLEGNLGNSQPTVRRRPLRWTNANHPSERQVLCVSIFTITHSTLLAIVYCLATSFDLVFRSSSGQFYKTSITVKHAWRWPVYEVETSCQAIIDRKHCALCDRNYR